MFTYICRGWSVSPLTHARDKFPGVAGYVIPLNLQKNLFVDHTSAIYFLGEYPHLFLYFERSLYIYPQSTE